MSHYKSNLRDIEFNLFELFGRQEILGSGPFAEVDEETARDMLVEVNRLALGPVADSLVDSDRNPPAFDPATGNVTMPESVKKSYRALMDAEWWRLAIPPELGGTQVPRSLQWAVASFILGANPALWMYANGPTFARILWLLGTPEQKRFAELAIERQWGATMVLTEPDAGSDVGTGRTKAIRQPDGTWHIEGVKRFITVAEHDMSENIFHLVLARPEGAGPGTKGLSMFLVSKYHVNSGGSLGERNGYRITNVEHKMGLKVSTTCEMTFGADPARPAVGTLIGDVHDGIRQMFMVIEHARMMVGFKAIETLSTGYLNALEYAKNRVQGPDLAKQNDKSSPRVTIINHPDVRRMLMLQKAYAEGMRALVLYTATQQDAAQLAEHAGEQDPAAAARNDLLLPVIKAMGGERAYEMLTLSLQTFGGSGYLQDYPIEQYIRDSKIDSLYEGTTAIQSLDFFFRKTVRDQGAAVRSLLGEVAAFASADDSDGRLKTERAAIAEAVSQVEAMLNAFTGFLVGSLEQPEEIYKIGQQSVRLLLAFGDLIVAWLLARQAEVAARALETRASETRASETRASETRASETRAWETRAWENSALDTAEALSASDRDFYTGKVAAARFFTATVLPRLESDRKIIESTTNDLMTMPEGAF
jgi:alkylation response protein AidB-like acyl-CoA dehydrogenase